MTDLISSLPDDILRVILLRRRDSAAAARTSVLSRRWRRVWLHLPELSFRYKNHPIYRGRAHERIDAALAAHTAGKAVALLDIGLPTWKPPRAAAAAAYPTDPNRLLQFASRRVAGELRLSLDSCVHWDDEIVLPTCERATAIKLSICRHNLRFQPHPGGGGAFAALATLRIENAHVYGGELEDVVSSRCPLLNALFLERVILKDGGRALSIRSDSLERLEMVGMNLYCFNPHLHLQVIAPELRILSPGTLADGHIVAPKLSELSWHGRYDPVRHHIGEAGRHLRRLEIADTGSPAPMLMRRFNTVHELQVTIIVTQGIAAYERFVNDANYLPKCGTLSIHLYQNYHGFAPSMLHLLRKCNGVRNFTVYLSYVESSIKGPSCPLPCPCRLPESCRADDITLDSLVVVEIDVHKGSHEVVEFVKRLSQCNAAILKKW